jgi:hypothetical protein
MGTEILYDGTLEGLFALLDRLWRGALREEQWPRRVRRQAGPVPASVTPSRRDGVTQGLLFDEGAPGPAEPPPAPPAPGRPPAPPAEAAAAGDPAGDPAEDAAGILAQVSAEAYGALVQVWMSELPLEGEALRYALRVLASARRAAATAPAAAAAMAARAPAVRAAPRGAAPGQGPWYGREEARLGAGAAARDRLDGDCRAVLAAAYKVAHELDRLRGFLRFSPDGRGRYLARCSPDYFVLPALAPHFGTRFGDTPWIVVDEKRGLALIGEGRGETRLVPAGEEFWDPGGNPGTWEELWRRYHRIISIEGRKNPSLQRRFIPLRYRNYLNEFGPSPGGEL